MEITRITCRELDIERSFCIFQIELIDDIFRLHNSDLVVVERYVIINVFAIVEEAVVCNYGNAFLMGLFQGLVNSQPTGIALQPELIMFSIWDIWVATSFEAN